VLPDLTNDDDDLGKLIDRSTKLPVKIISKMGRLKLAHLNREKYPSKNLIIWYR
jgi:hypothetical protein